MKNILFILLICIGLTSCQLLTREYTTENNVETLKHSYSRLAVKDYEIKGVVHTHQTTYCFIFGFFCTNDIFIHDDLMRQSEKLGANHVINLVMDKNVSSPFWYMFFSKQTYKANALAVKLTKSENKVIYGYSE